HLLRHGEVHNPDGVLYGRIDGFGLSQSGAAMAVTIADHVADLDITHLVSSPLQRAQETAAPISERLGLPVHLDDRLLEPTNVFEGTRFGVGDGALKRPANWKHLRNPFRPSWGEPYAEIAARMMAAVQAARAAAEGHQALCVSHQLPIWTLRRFLEGRRLWHDPRKRECGLASLTSISFDAETFAGISYSEPAGPTDPDAVPGA
ncbi:MAG: histidine phosphatase family protein, partial [Geodermatophilaceae bacterium]|nr:histidine phosphatase family protein [Geodermatophilaceae bacterium]